MPKYTYHYRRQHYVIEAADRAAGYQILMAQLKEQAAKNKAAKLAKQAHSMTCQCCGRAIFAETGVIAHHGYERPGSGWQTASCHGARHVPFEVSRDALGLMLTAMRAHLARQEAYRACVDAETEPCRVDVPDRSKPKVWGRGYPNMTVDVTRENYATFRAQHEAVVFSRGLHDFDGIKVRYLAGLDSQIKLLAAHIKEQQKRFDGWKQTHHREDDTWVAITNKESGS